MQIRPTGPCPAKVMIVGEAPGEREVAEGQPFVGFAGQELSKMLSEAGIMRSECFITNVVRIRPPGNDINAFIAQKKSDISAQHIMLRDKFVLPAVRDGFELLKREIEMCQPNVIIAFGNVALWALTGQWGITSWRGSVMECDLELALDYKPKVVPAYHPATILRQWSWRQIAIHDLRRAKTQADYRAVIRPDYRFIVRPDYTTATAVLTALMEELNELRAGTIPLIEKSTTSQWLLGVDSRAVQARVRLRVFAWLLRTKGAPFVLDLVKRTNSGGNASSPHLSPQELRKPSTLEASHQQGKQSGQVMAKDSWELALTAAKAGDLGSLQRHWEDAEASSKGIWASLEDGAKRNLRDAAQLKLAVDIETRAGHTACIGIAWSDRDAACWPLMCVEHKDGYWPLEQEAAISFALYQLLTHPNCEVIGQNFSYDAQYFYRHLHFIPRLKRDTMLTQHVLFSNLQKGLDFLSSMYCEHHLYWKDEGKEWDAKTGEDQLWTYNCKDAVITFEVDTAQQAAVDQMRLREVHDFQQRLFWPVLDSMNRGLRVDTSRRGEFAFTLQEEIAKREQWLIDTLGEPLNIKSPLQMKRMFYETLGQKPVLSRKTGGVTCDDEALRKIAEREPLLLPVTKKIAELRSLGVFLSTFVNAPLDTDGRMRCSFNIGGTETYRFSSSKNAFGSGLNLQNIPKGGGDDELELPNVRSLFIPDPGMTFFDIDLSSADLRIVVWESDEPDMKALLKAGLDPYTEIAKEFYHDPSITKKDPRRQTFKSFAHGTNYLGTAKGLAERLGLGVHEAEKTQKWYFGRFPKIKKWQDDLKDQVYKRRMVQNVFGYRCYFFDRIEGTIFNQAAAWIPQSTVACLINRAYVKIYEELKDVQVLLQVHDSLAGQFPTHLGDWMVKQIVAKAEIELPYPGDPLVIPVGVATSDKSWGECR